MKPFNLYEAQKGLAIQTRDGRHAQFISYVPQLGALSVIAMLDKQPKAETFTSSGQYLESGIPCENDLFMVGLEKVMYTNVYRAPNSPTGFHSGELYDSLEEAEQSAARGAGHIATIALEFVA